MYIRRKVDRGFAALTHIVRKARTLTNQQINPSCGRTTFLSALELEHNVISSMRSWVRCPQRHPTFARGLISSENERQENYNSVPPMMGS